MDRTQLIRRLCRAVRCRTYLEIGVCEGGNFLKIRAWRKYAVDPHMQIHGKLKRYLANPTNLFNRYFPMTSDAFFETQQPMLEAHGLDVVLVDGLHTYAQALKDTEASLRYLRPGGVIVLHDCNPPIEAAAVPACSLEHARSLNVPGWTGSWNGDVWKTIVHLRATRKDLYVCVVDCDEGLGLITRGSPDDMLTLQPEEIAGLTYRDLDARRGELLNLKDAAHVDAFLDKVGAGRGS